MVVYAKASFYRFPRPPTKGLTFSGKIYLIFRIKFTLASIVCLVSYFLRADKSCSGIVNKAPGILVCIHIYFLENIYKLIDLIVNQIILYPF